MFSFWVKDPIDCLHRFFIPFLSRGGYGWKGNALTLPLTLVLLAGRLVVWGRLLTLGSMPADARLSAKLTMPGYAYGL